MEGRQTYSISRLKTVSDEEILIALLRCPEQGNTASQTVAHNLIEDIDPKWIIVAGIAGAVPSSEYTLGDVLVATRLKDFSVSAHIENHDGLSTKEFDTRGGPMHPAVQSLIAAIPAIEPHLERWNTPEKLSVSRPKVKITPNDLYGDKSWKNKVKTSLELFFGAHATRSEPVVFPGSVGSSDILVKDTKLIQQWLTASRHLDGVEMELTGVYQAAWTAQKPVLAVRGISDIVGFKRSPEWTAYACHTAASFLVALLRGHPPFTPSFSDTVTETADNQDLPDSRLILPLDTNRTHHYTARALPLLGRDAEMETLRKFSESSPSFQWMQIAGAGGQGKSRLALEFAIDLEKKGWAAGFLQTNDLIKLSASWRKWQPQKPTLVITDYVIGFEHEIGNAIRDFSNRNNLAYPVRWLILERQRWDRGYVNFEQIDDEEETEGSEINSSSSLGGSGIADWFTRLSVFHDNRDIRIDSVKFEPSVIELKALREEQLITIVKSWSAKKNLNISFSDEELQEILARIDPTGRPLYAYFLAEALTANFSVKGWKRDDLLRATLSKDYRHRWQQHFDSSPPNLGDDHPALRLALLATLVGSLDVRRLREIEGWIVPTSDIRKQTLALVDGSIGSDVSGPRELIPKLEPDILGGWFILDIASHAVIDVSEILKTSWSLAPKETAATLLRLAQDFPRNGRLHELLLVSPPSVRGERAYTDVALELLVAIRDKVSVQKINLIPKILLAAENGNDFAMAQLGLCYRYGIGMSEPVPQKAFYWFNRGAEAGNARAMTYLGHCYFSGIGVEQRDLDAALKWFRKGAEAGEASAMTYLGIFIKMELLSVKTRKKQFSGFLKERKWETALVWSILECYF